MTSIHALAAVDAARRVRALRETGALPDEIRRAEQDLDVAVKACVHPDVTNKPPVARRKEARHD